MGRKEHSVELVQLARDQFLGGTRLRHIPRHTGNLAGAGLLHVEGCISGDQPVPARILDENTDVPGSMAVQGNQPDVSARRQALALRKCTERPIVQVWKLWAEARTASGQCPTNGDLASIQAWITGDANDVAACLSGTCPPIPKAFPATGQTTSYGTGSDGAVQAGATLSYTDNGDGTVTDNNTGLMWEKKSKDGSIHDWYTPYGAWTPHRIR